MTAYRVKAPGISVWHALAVSIGAAYALVVMEWLFFVTKPSFLSFFPAARKLVVLAVAPLPILAAAAIPSLLATLAAQRARGARLQQLLRFAALLAPVLVLGSLFVLMADNFTTTLFHVGILKSTGPMRWLFAAGVAAAYAIAFALLRRVWTAGSAAVWQRAGLVGLALVATSTGVAAIVAIRSPRAASVDPAAPGASDRRPDIVILSGDGLDADHLSCYGYARDTTPFLASVAQRALLCANTFTNCAHTSGSIASLLTGRLPTQTRVVYPPDVLTGTDVYRHLPGILRRAGYRTYHMSIRHYADAFDLNLRGGFDRSTFRDARRLGNLDWLAPWLGNEPMFFADQVVDRTRLRLLHVAGAGELPDSYQEVGAARVQVFADPLRLGDLEEFVNATPGPFFAHIHLMGTHGPRFHPRAPHFASAAEQTEAWMPDFYDDAIRDFDEITRLVMSGLVAPRRWRPSNTLVIVLSDHGMGFTNRVRVPLLMFFPGGAHAGVQRSNAQLVDVAPTVLDYLGLEVPEWMAGRSLLAGEADPLRPVFSAERTSTPAVRRDNRWLLDLSALRPPFYSMGKTTMIVCDRAYTIDWETNEMHVQHIDSHTAACGDSLVPTPEDARQRILQHLGACGYDLSALPLPTIVGP